MDFVERQGYSERADWRDKHHRQEKRQGYIEQENYARPAGQINKLLEGKRPENLAFYFYKLWNLKTHAFKFEIRISKFETNSKL